MLRDRDDANEETTKTYANAAGHHLDQGFFFERMIHCFVAHLELSISRGKYSQLTDLSLLTAKVGNTDHRTFQMGL